MAVGDRASAAEALAEGSLEGDGAKGDLFDFFASEEIDGRNILPEPAFAAEGMLLTFTPFLFL